MWCKIAEVSPRFSHDGYLSSGTGVCSLHLSTISCTSEVQMESKRRTGGGQASFIHGLSKCHESHGLILPCCVRPPSRVRTHSASGAILQTWQTRWCKIATTWPPSLPFQLFAESMMGCSVFGKQLMGCRAGGITQTCFLHPQKSGKTGWREQKQCKFSIYSQHFKQHRFPGRYFFFFVTVCSAVSP